MLLECLICVIRIKFLPKFFPNYEQGIERTPSKGITIRDFIYQVLRKVYFPLKFIFEYKHKVFKQLRETYV